MYYKWSGLKAIHTLITITQTESTLDPLPVHHNIWRFCSLSCPFLLGLSYYDQVLEEDGQNSNIAAKSKYVVHRIDTANLEFTVYPEWSLEAIGNVPHLT